MRRTSLANPKVESRSTNRIASTCERRPGACLHFRRISLYAGHSLHLTGQSFPTIAFGWVTSLPLEFIREKAKRKRQEKVKGFGCFAWALKRLAALSYPFNGWNKKSSIYIVTSIVQARDSSWSWSTWTWGSWMEFCWFEVTNSAIRWFNGWKFGAAVPTSRREEA